MKGIVFTEFLEMVEDRFGPQVTDQIIAASDLESGGAYTAVGTYDYQELAQLVTNLCQLAKIPAPDLLRWYGKHLFSRFFASYPRFFDGVESTFGFLATIDAHIHVEVRKLYPDAELPSFECSTPDPGSLTMIYRSKRAFGDLAEGLIAGCIEHFGEQIDLRREDLSAGQGTIVRFSLNRRD